MKTAASENWMVQLSHAPKKQPIVTSWMAHAPVEHHIHESGSHREALSGRGKERKAQVDQVVGQRRKVQQQQIEILLL